jgi:putative ATP-dependent endonuclease of the OLD family
MKLREIKIQNFRSLEDISMTLNDTTVLIGENNSGKTALLEAIRIALTRSNMVKGTIFDEYDYHMDSPEDTPQSCKGIIIELWFREDKTDEWPESLLQALNEIIQTDVEFDLDSIGFRISSKYDSITKEFVNKVEFLTLDGQPLGGKAASSVNISRFFSYVRVFYLSALRDSQEEFSPKSQFWGKILRNLEIDEEQRGKFNEDLERLNESLLHADVRLESVRTTLEKAQTIMGVGSEQSTSIQALPMKPWELMSRSELVIKPRGSQTQFPLSHHGQGTQSLSVLFLFQAYIDVLLKPMFQVETEAILALEEPESHLHPQAVRALAANLMEIKSQKVISSHSPYFIQEIPFSQIRMFSRNGVSTKVCSLDRFFTVILPSSPKLQSYCDLSKGKFIYYKISSSLRVYGQLEQKEYRKLIQIYPDQPEVIQRIKNFYIKSQSYISNDELADLETYAKRIRGEILFAKGWILCEGQCEYMLIREFSEMKKKPLDNYGISVIDFKNNGSAGAFVSLARAFQIPWVMLCDNDDAGKGYVEEVRKKGVDQAALKEMVYILPEDGMDLELYLTKNGFDQNYLQILQDSGKTISTKAGDPGYFNEIAERVRERKTENVIALIQKMREFQMDEKNVPDLITNVIDCITSKVV